MKQYIYQMMILAVSTCLWSCQDDDPKPTVVEEPDWKLELVENDPEPEWEMPESGIYKASESFPFIDEGVKGTEEEPFTISLQPVVN